MKREPFMIDMEKKNLNKDNKDTLNNIKKILIQMYI